MIHILNVQLKVASKRESGACEKWGSTVLVAGRHRATGYLVDTGESGNSWWYIGFMIYAVNAGTKGRGIVYFHRTIIVGRKK